VNLDSVPSGQDLPDTVNVIIEIPAHTYPVNVLVVSPQPWNL
jgi:hypothetical protein